MYARVKSTLIVFSLTEWRVFLAEDVKARRFKGYVIGRDDVPVRRQVQPVVELTKEIRQACVCFGQSFQHHFRLSAAMIGQQYLAEPTLADDLKNVELIAEVHLQIRREYIFIGNSVLCPIFAFYIV